MSILIFASTIELWYILSF